MCGIVAYLDKTGANDAPVGQVMLKMLLALCIRGPDSAGVALYGEGRESRLAMRIKLLERGPFETQAAGIIERVEDLAPVKENMLVEEYLRLVVEYDGTPRALEEAVEAVGEGIEVVSMGRRLEIVKQVGSPEKLEATYGISAVRGTHAIGHTRLSTESRVDLSHSQPFWAHGVLDLAVVHNGHITNYHKLRRRYEIKGRRFYTENDSEIIGVYLADQMAKGLTFKEALLASIRDLDGSFCYLAATAEEVGFAKDPFGLKPLVVAETDDFVAIATEEIALRKTFEGEFATREPGAKEVRTWQLQPQPVTVPEGRRWA